MTMKPIKVSVWLERKPALLRLCRFIQYPILWTIQEQEAIKTHCVFYYAQFSGQYSRPSHVTLKLETVRLIKFFGV